MDMKVILNPHSRVTMRISVEAYAKFSGFILQILKSEKQIFLLDLLHRVEENSYLDLAGDAKWYLLKVKQDLEARRIIKIKRDLRDGTIQTIKLHHYKSAAKSLH
jgi:hypothetical protein